jgi:hypothetical protein
MKVITRIRLLKSRNLAVKVKEFLAKKKAENAGVR